MAAAGKEAEAQRLLSEADRKGLVPPGGGLRVLRPRRQHVQDGQKLERGRQRLLPRGAAAAAAPEQTRRRLQLRGCRERLQEGGSAGGRELPAPRHRDLHGHGPFHHRCPAPRLHRRDLRGRAGGHRKGHRPLRAGGRLLQRGGIHQLGQQVPAEGGRVRGAARAVPARHRHLRAGGGGGHGQPPAQVQRQGAFLPRRALPLLRGHAQRPAGRAEVRGDVPGLLRLPGMQTGQETPGSARGAERRRLHRRREGVRRGLPPGPVAHHGAAAHQEDDPGRGGGSALTPGTAGTAGIRAVPGTRSRRFPPASAVPDPERIKYLTGAGIFVGIPPGFPGKGGWGCPHSPRNGPQNPP